MLATAETIDWGLKLLNIPPLWRETKGEGIKVAVLDTGIALEHPDLKPSLIVHPQPIRSQRRPRSWHPRGWDCSGATQRPRHRRRRPLDQNYFCQGTER
ncbi:MAG: S8 family serine peptidase [Verrucomicrobiota bacterium]